jgi:TatD DNase family protein
MWIDIGVNLTHSRFDPDRDAVIARAIDAGVERMILTSSDGPGVLAAKQLRQRDPERLWITSGIHPHEAGQLRDEDWETVCTHAEQPDVVAIGECGLDYFRNLSEPEQQRRIFEKQVELAIRLGKPLFLHERHAHADLLAILENAGPALPKAVLHCFTGTAVELEHYLTLGLWIGLTGWVCDERRGRHLVALLPEIPEDRLLIETDAPYLLPRTLPDPPRNKRNEPAFLPHIAAFLASHLNRDLMDFSSQLRTNSFHFFWPHAAFQELPSHAHARSFSPR